MAPSSNSATASSEKTLFGSGELAGIGTHTLQHLLEQAFEAVKVSQPAESDVTEGATPPSAPFVEMLLRPTVLTENGAPTYATSGSALVDFFFNIVEDSPHDTVRRFVQEAWKENPLDTLKLVGHLRDIRHGKGDCYSAHECMAWLFQHYPRTAVANLEAFGKVGYWKDMLIILARQCVGEIEWRERERFATERMANKGANHYSRKFQKKQRRAQWLAHLHQLSDAEKVEAAKVERAKHFMEKEQQEMAEAAMKRKEKKFAAAENARKKLNTDPSYRLLHLKVATLFAQQLKEDKTWLEEKKDKARVSLAAKWAPSPNRSHDKDTLISSTIAEILFPYEEFKRPNEGYTDFIVRARIKYQKEYLMPLRAHLKLPEVYMAARRWNEVDYTRVASVCMKRNKKNFEYHDKERFTQYLAQVKSGEKKIAAGALKPHELVREVMQNAGVSWSSPSTSSETSLEVVELQWRAYVDKLKESGVLNSAMAICDVSGSMSGQPMEVAIALSLLTADVTAPPFNQLICTFSAQPQLHLVKGNTLQEKVQDIAAMDWQMNTDLNAVFKLLLDRAVATKLDPKDMIKTLFIFSDMEFDQATNTTNYDHSSYGYYSRTYRPEEAPRTTHEEIKAQFKQHGYELPHIVYWNLAGRERLHGRGGSSIPVTVDENGTALVSGFSGQLLKLFMEGSVETMTPMSVVKAAIQDRYNDWVLAEGDGDWEMVGNEQIANVA